ncbi:MAG: hypothetical protein WA101_01690, partial [Minisyncoccia bacterium]
MNPITQKNKLIAIIAFILISTTIILFFIIRKPNKTEIPEKLPEQVRDQGEKVEIPSVKTEEVKPIPIPEGTDRFIITLTDTNETIANNLFDQEYITDKDTFVKILNEIKPGGYKISKEMTPQQIASV